MTEGELKQRIDAMLSERDRNVARILLEHTLPGMQKYYEEKVEELRQQLFEEKTEKLNHYEIAITISETTAMADALIPCIGVLMI